jgi:hypothetical protein
MASPRGIRVRGANYAICALLVVLACALGVAAQSPAQQQARVPVLVELFTSEGCSDCPPADRLLEELDTKQPVPGVRAIVLSEHVTYWNHQGWTDPFSLDTIDFRQKEYGDRFNIESIYTPQAVIDGSAQLVGNNAAGVEQAIERAAATPKKSLTIADAHWDSDAVSFTVHGEADPKSKVVAVVAADAQGAKITRGENAGKTLHHVAVVRTIKEFGANAADGRPLRLSAANLAHVPASTPVRLVVFLVDKKTGHVTAAEEQTLRR